MLAGLDPATYPKHALHQSDRQWPDTNCYTDLWIEVLDKAGCAPEAALGFTVMQDFEGDHFTFFKVLPEDLEMLFGIRVTELAIFDTVEAHVLAQMQRGRLSLVEVDGFYLPDTRGVSYRNTHPKTTIAINRMDMAGKVMHYFHNSGYHALEGEDFDGVLNRLPQQQREDYLFPYVEFVKFPARPVQPKKADVLAILSRHLAKAPQVNPFTAYRADLPAHLDSLSTRPPDYFHIYAFNILRQTGANFELLDAHIAWLEGQGEAAMPEARAAAMEIATGTKTLQFQLARAMARKKYDGLEVGIERLAEAYHTVMTCLKQRYL